LLLSLIKQSTMKKIFALLLKILGVLFVGIALLCAWGALNAFLERAQHGAGLMFADAEIFLLLTIVFLLLGVVCIWIGTKLKA
jgi:cell division protein FtsX